MSCKAQMVALILCFGLAACEDQINIAEPLTTAASQVASLNEGGSGSTQIAAVPVTAVTNAEATFEATLTPASADQVIAFRIRSSRMPAGSGDLIGTAVTNLSGVARLTVAVGQTPGSYLYDASFDPGGSSPPLIASATLTVLDRQATQVSVKPMTVVGYERATFEATLTPAVAGRQITFVIRSSVPSVLDDYATAVTNASGVAKATMLVKQPRGSYVYDARFGGDGSYLPTSAWATLDVISIPTQLTADSFFGPDKSLILRSRILPQLRDKDIEFRLNGALVATVRTDRKGMASIVVRPVWAPGTVLQITYTFAGDQQYDASSNTQLLVVPAPDDKR